MWSQGSILIASRMPAMDNMSVVGRWKRKRGTYL